MKTALCFYGQPRFLEEAYNHTYREIIDFYNCDVFVHTYWSKDHIGQKYPSRVSKDFEAADIELKPDTIDKINNFYNPKALKIDWYEDIKLTHKQYQYYTQYEVKNLKKDYEELHNIKYDMIIRSRFDFVLNVKKYNFDIDFLWVPDTCPNPELFSDNFSVSSSENYDKISDCYVSLENNNALKYMPAEYDFREQVNRCGITVKKFKCEADVIRSNRLILSI
jgi:hypothetical protein